MKRAVARTPPSSAARRVGDDGPSRARAPRARSSASTSGSSKARASPSKKRSSCSTASSSRGCARRPRWQRRSSSTSRANAERAEQSYLSVISLLERVGDRRLAALCLGFRGIALAQQCRYSEARRVLGRAIVDIEPFGDRWSHALLLSHRAVVEAMAGHRRRGGCTRGPKRAAWAVPWPTFGSSACSRSSARASRRSR
jgi:hypothetical protein